jgi:molybdopterin converting factor small subunit
VAVVVLPPRLRALAGGAERVQVDARDVRGLIAALDARFPGIAEQLRGSGAAVAIDGEIVNDPLLEPVDAGSEVHFLPAIRGGVA